MNIYLDTDTHQLLNASGSPVRTAEVPKFAYTAEIPVVVSLVTEDFAAAALLAEGWTANVAISTTADETDTPEIWVDSADVTVDHEAQTLSFLADGLTEEFQDAITGQANPVEAWFGVKLFAPGETKPRYSFRIWKVYLDNVVYDESATPPTEPTSDYYTKSEITALIAGKADSHPNRTDIGRDLVDGDNLFVGFGLLAACSRVYTYIAAKLGTAYGLLSTAQKTTLTGGGNADDLHTHAGTGADSVTSPAGTTVLGKVYRRTADGWQAADPDDLACETALLWIALGANATDGMRAEAVVTNPSWSWAGIPGTAVWMGEDGAITETVPTEESHTGKFGRQVGWVESATAVRFCGKLQAVYYPGAVS